MSICIISDHIIMLRQNFISYNTQHIDQVKPKYEGGGGGGFSPQSPPPPPPLDSSLSLYRSYLSTGIIYLHSVTCIMMPIKCLLRAELVMP